MMHEQLDTEMTRKICEIVLHEREMSLSEREWKFRLRGYGYGLRDSDDGRIITSLLKGTDLCTLPDPVAEDSEAEAERKYAA